MLIIALGLFYVLWNKSSKKEQALREQVLEFQYQKLKSQVNPHFLFNSFNVLSGLLTSLVAFERKREVVSRNSQLYSFGQLLHFCVTHCE